MGNKQSVMAGVNTSGRDKRDRSAKRRATKVTPTSLHSNSTKGVRYSRKRKSGHATPMEEGDAIQTPTAATPASAPSMVHIQSPTATYRSLHTPSERGTDLSLSSALSRSMLEASQKTVVVKTPDELIGENRRLRKELVEMRMRVDRLEAYIDELLAKVVQTNPELLAGGGKPAYGVSS